MSCLLSSCFQLSPNLGSVEVAWTLYGAFEDDNFKGCSVGDGPVLHWGSHTLPGLATFLNPAPIGGGPVALGAGLVWWATWFQPWCCKERQMEAKYEASAA